MNRNNNSGNTISIKSWLNEKIDPPHVIALIIAILPTIGLVLYASRRVFINAWYALVGWVLSSYKTWLSATSSILYIVWGAAFCYSIYAFIRKKMSRKSIGIWVVFDMAFPLIGVVLYEYGMLALAFSMLPMIIIFAVGGILSVCPTFASLLDRH